MKLKKVRNVGFLILVLAGFSVPAGLPDQPQWEYLYEIGRTLDLTAQNTTISPSTGGTSVYAVVKVNGKPKGAVLPENSSTSISGEIMTFHLARALGYSEIYQPAVYFDLTGPSLKLFRNMVQRMSPGGELKTENRSNILARIARNPNGIAAVYKDWQVKPKDYDAIVAVDSNAFNSRHVLPGSRTYFGNFLKCKGPMPSSSVIVKVNGGTSNELAMAKQLSTIFLIDALTQQFDRFSGGNLHTIQLNNEVKFASIDNGGTWGGLGWTRTFLRLVSRFDRNVAEGILEMDDFISRGVPYKDLTTQTEFIDAMGISRVSKQFENFKAALKLTAAHIRANPCYFE